MAKVVKVACAPYNLYAWIIGMTLLLREPQISSPLKTSQQIKSASEASTDWSLPTTLSKSVLKKGNRAFFTRFKFWKVGGNNDDWQAVSNFVMFADDTYDKFNPPTS